MLAADRAWSAFNELAIDGAPPLLREAGDPGWIHSPFFEYFCVRACALACDLVLARLAAEGRPAGRLAHPLSEWSRPTPAHRALFELFETHGRTLAARGTWAAAAPPDVRAAADPLLELFMPTFAHGAPNPDLGVDLRPSGLHLSARLALLLKINGEGLALSRAGLPVARARLVRPKPLARLSRRAAVVAVRAQGQPCWMVVRGWQTAERETLQQSMARAAASAAGWRIPGEEALAELPWPQHPRDDWTTRTRLLSMQGCCAPIGDACAFIEDAQIELTVRLVARGEAAGQALAREWRAEACDSVCVSVFCDALAPALPLIQFVFGL